MVCEQERETSRATAAASSRTLRCRAEVFCSRTWRKNSETAIEFASYPAKKAGHRDTLTPEVSRNPRRMYQISSSSVTPTWEPANLEEVRGKPSTAASPHHHRQTT